MSKCIDEEIYSDRRRAIHEAGHALLAWHYKWKIKRVSIKKTENFQGYFELEKSETQRSDQENIEIHLAGMVSEKIIFDDYYISGRDYKKAECYAIKKYLKTQYKIKLSEHFLNLCDLFESYKEAIELLAEKLLQKTTINGDDVKKIIESTQLVC